MYNRIRCPTGSRSRDDSENGGDCERICSIEKKPCSAAATPFAPWPASFMKQKRDCPEVEGSKTIFSSLSQVENVYPQLPAQNGNKFSWMHDQKSARL
jgi:hypothetical protein